MRAGRVGSGVALLSASTVDGGDLAFEAFPTAERREAS
jgi:hypothetical protein